MNDNFLIVYPVEHSERKAVDETPPDAGMNDRPPFGIIPDVLDGGIDLVEEVAAESRSLKFVILGGIKHFEFGWA